MALGLYETWYGEIAHGRNRDNGDIHLDITDDECWIYSTNGLMFFLPLQGEPATYQPWAVV